MFKTTKKIIKDIDNYLSHVNSSSVIFKKGMIDFLSENDAEFKEQLKEMAKTEHFADALKREIENTLYSQSLLPESRSDVLRLIERLDELIDTAKEILVNFDIEKPYIPGEFHHKFFELSDVACRAVEVCVEATKVYFHNPSDIKETLRKIYLLEKEADNISNQLKIEVFNNNELNLSQKMHIRYFTARTDLLADTAESVADLLSISSIKLIV